MAQGAGEGEAQRVARAAVVLLVAYDRGELILGQQLDGAGRDVYPRTQIAGAKRLGRRVAHDRDAGVAGERPENAQFAHETAVRAEVAESVSGCARERRQAER